MKSSKWKTWTIFAQRLANLRNDVEMMGYAAQKQEQSFVALTEDNAFRLECEGVLTLEQELGIAGSKPKPKKEEKPSPSTKKRTHSHQMILQKSLRRGPTAQDLLTKIRIISLLVVKSLQKSLCASTFLCTQKTKHVLKHCIDMQKPPSTKRNTKRRPHVSRCAECKQQQPVCSMVLVPTR